MNPDSATPDGGANVPAAAPARRLVLYDGVCGLCNRSVQFLLKRDRAAVLTFAPLQGQSGTQVLQRHPEFPQDLSTMIYVRDHGAPGERVFTRSDSMLMILHDIGGFWRVVSWLRIVPRFIRDGVYNFVARNRYRWFGKRESCRVPEGDVRGRFLE